MRRNYAFLSSFFYTVSGLHFPLILPANQDPPQPADPNRTLPLRDKVACHPFPSPFPIFSPALGRDPSRTPDGGWDPSFPVSRSPSRSWTVHRYLRGFSWDSPLTNPAHRPETLVTSGRSSTKARALQDFGRLQSAIQEPIEVWRGLRRRDTRRRNAPR